MSSDTQHLATRLAKAVDAHFDSSTPQDVVRRTRQLMLYASEIDSEPEAPSPEDSLLCHTRSHPVPLDAYLACGLTGLTGTDRSLMLHLSDIVATVCKEVDINLYEPRKNTDPAHNPNTTDSEVFKIDRDRVVRSDLVIHLCHFASTGSGEELDFAYNALIPIVLIIQGDQKVSRMVTGIPSLKVEVRYREPEELRSMLASRLFEIRAYLEQRKLTRDGVNENVVGQRIKELRLRTQMPREQLASMVGLTKEGLKSIEDNADRISNPSLTCLREIATALKTTVADLIVPDLEAYVVSAIESIMYQQQAARFSGMSKKDRDRLLRRLLYRILDSIEQPE